jgi:hypothetical protein
MNTGGGIPDRAGGALPRFVRPRSRASTRSPHGWCPRAVSAAWSGSRPAAGPEGSYRPSPSGISPPQPTSGASKDSRRSAHRREARLHPSLETAARILVRGMVQSLRASVCLIWYRGLCARNGLVETVSGLHGRGHRPRIGLTEARSTVCGHAPRVGRSRFCVGSTVRIALGRCGPRSGPYGRRFGQREARPLCGRGL